MRLLPFRILPLPFLAFVESNQFRQKHPRDRIDHVLRNLGVFRFAPV